MKHSLAVRFLVMLLTAICLVAALAGIMSIVSLEGAGLYINSLDELQDQAEYLELCRSRMIRLAGSSEDCTVTWESDEPEDEVRT